MTVRDGARFLPQALESVRAQTFADWELVLVDDGSTDDTLDIARRFAADDPRIRVFAEPARGRRSALELAHRHARGAYLGWIDADDWLAPEALERTHAAITTWQCDMIYTSHVVVTADGKQRGPSRRARIPYSAQRLLIDFMTFHFRLFTRDVFERAGGIDPDRDIAIDYDLCLRISEHGRIEHVAEPLYFYRMHSAQMSTRKRSEQIAASADAIRAALVRRGMTSFELDVDLQRGRFRLVPRAPRVKPLRLAIATVFPQLRRGGPVETSHAIGCWPTKYAERGPGLVLLGDDLASLMRTVWTGRAGDTLRIYSLAPLFEADNDGSVRGLCFLFLKTLDHALARRMRLVWVTSDPHTTQSKHAERERACREALAARCHSVAADPRETKAQPIATVVERRRVPGTLPISVVIPIRNRAGVDVRNSLASLAWQRGGRPWETILVSHGSDPAIDAELRTLAVGAGVTLVTVGTPADPWCKPLALNTGILATDPAIAFVMTMDGDMMLAENFLETVLAELRDDPQRIVLCQSSDLPEGCTIPDDADVIRAQFDELRQQASVRGRFGTGGIQAVRRSFLLDVHGYDEDMLWWGALDTDLVRRAEAAGLRTTWVTDRTTMLHQWHPRKHRVLGAPGEANAAQGAWQRNHELMIQRAGDIVRNHHGWGATFSPLSVTLDSPK
jgi:glycosyltransferase involved in cell wall biosynthesis